MSRVLVIGASGFLGRHLALALSAGGHTVRCLARDPARAGDLDKAGCQLVQGDISDLASVQRALDCVQAVYISVHTLSRQPGNTARHSFMEVELNGLQNIVSACRTQGVRRLIYVTFLGAKPDSPSAWVRGRWQAEQLLLKSGLDVTVIRPGQIVGVGGRGFDMMMSQARKSIAITMGNGSSKYRNIALDDLTYYLVGVLNDARAYGQCYDVGSDEVLTNNQMMDVAADVLRRPHPLKIGLPVSLLRALAPLIERASKVPRGAMRGMVDSLKLDAIGDPLPIRKILPRSPLPYREAVAKALLRSSATQSKEK